VSLAVVSNSRAPPPVVESPPLNVRSRALPLTVSVTPAFTVSVPAPSSTHVVVSAGLSPISSEAVTVTV
jgi:hypothetical protein